ncbi:MAG: AAA family ATPase [Blastocatellia bacterium]|nr:AAA family ATPase [Blastocatellia bacterium]
MPKYDFRLTAIIRALENDTFIAEALFFPEVSRYGDDPHKLREALKNNAVKIIEDSPVLALHARRNSALPEIASCELLIDPPSPGIAWRKPVSLGFDILHWRHGDEALIAYVPALGIEVIAKNLEELETIVPAQIRAHLLRTKAASSLGGLVRLQRSRMILLDQCRLTTTIQTPKHKAAQSEEDKGSKKSVLEEVATDLTGERLLAAYEIDDSVARLAESLVGRNPRSVLLTGPSGVGKTAAVYEMVRRRQEFQLGSTPFWATSGSRLVAGMSGFGMWQERCGRLWREASKQNAILHMGNLLELMEVGKSTSDSQGIAAFLRPYISRGDMLVIAECTPEQLPVIERDDPQLLAAFSQIKVEQPSAEKGKAILLNYIVASSSSPPIDINGIEMVDRLHRRYATYSAYPGRPIRFLKNLIEDREEEKSITPEEITLAFSQETGLPLFLLDPSVEMDLRSATEWFGERVIGQASAVGLVVDLLATVKAGLARPGKPIASLLFIGPTGVGKTEMARSLAEFLFSDKDRMIRFDMSEYSDPLAVGRLIGGTWRSEGLLTSKVREQPFSVILLDELEKAAPEFFDLLLQALGEGRLTDSSGRVADFTNSVVIMTSNLGAESFRRSQLGFGKGADLAARAREHFLSEVRAFVRPEFFNRIDRVVPFAPLNEETVLRIARRETLRLKDRDGILYRGVNLDLPDEVARYLARKGYDSRYGARPLKRAVERELLVPLAECLNRQPADVALTADVRVEGDSLSVDVQTCADQSGRRISTVIADGTMGEIASRAVRLRRNLQLLERSSAVVELQNDIFRLSRLEKRLSRQSWKAEEDLRRLGRLSEISKGIEALKSLLAEAYSLEDEILMALYGRARGDRERLTGRVSGALREWDDLLLSIYSLQFDRPDYITLAVYGENLKWLFDLSHVYFTIARASGANPEVFKFKSYQPKGDKSEQVETFKLLGRAVIKEKVAEPGEFLSASRLGVVGIILGISAHNAFPRYEPERGLHLYTEEKKTHGCLVHTSETPSAEYKPLAELEKRGAIALQDRRRSFNHEEMMIDDAALKKKLPWRYTDTIEIMRRAIELRLIEEATSILATSSED